MRPTVNEFFRDRTRLETRHEPNWVVTGNKSSNVVVWTVNQHLSLTMSMETNYSPGDELWPSVLKVFRCLTSTRRKTIRNVSLKRYIPAVKGRCRHAATGLAVSITNAQNNIVLVSFRIEMGHSRTQPCLQKMFFRSPARIRHSMKCHTETC